MIYEKNNNQMRKVIKDFHKTNYGKSMFLICFSPFVISAVFTIITFFLCVTDKCLPFYSLFMLITTFGTIILFCTGSYAYYKELREFVHYSKKSKK